MDRFRGSAPARLDEKGRLKVPNLFRQQIEEAFGRDLFVTSIHGRNFLLYPLPIWRALSPDARRALQYAAERIERYHAAAMPKSWRITDEHGSVLGQEVRPLDRHRDRLRRQ